VNEGRREEAERGERRADETQPPAMNASIITDVTPPLTPARWRAETTPTRTRT